jgi:hypothetical protein
MIKLSILAFALGAVALPAAAGMQSGDARRCQQLITTFDRLSPDFEHNASRRDRDLGEAECRKGNYTAGEKLLEMALMSFGYSPS